MAATLREYISVKPPSGNSPQVKAMRPLLVSQNRLGGAVTYFGKQIKDLSEIMSVHADISSALVTEEDTLLEDEHEHRMNLIKPLTPISPLVEQGRKQDEKAEDAQEDDEEDDDAEDVGEKIAEKEEKKLTWWQRLLKGFAPIVNFISNAFTAFVAYKAFDWLSDPNNQKNAKIVLKGLGAIVGAAAKIASFGVFQVMEGVTKVFGTNPDSKGIGKVFDKLFGVLQIFGGLGSLWAASRLLMPWKLVGDYKKMKKLGDTLNKIKKFFQRKPKVPKVTTGKGGKVKGKPKAKITGSKVGIVDRAKQFGKKKLSQVKNLKNTVVSKVKGIPKTISKITGNMKNMGKSIGNFGKNVFTRGRDLIGKGKNFVKSAVDKGKDIYKGATEWAAKNAKRAKNLATKVKGGVFDWGKKIGAKMNQLKEMVKNPKAMFKPVMERIKSTIKPIIEKNPNIKKVLNLKNAKTGLKNAKNFALKNVKLAMKSKEMANLAKFLKEAKGRVKIGGIDKVVAAVLGLIDYGMGESPINALVSATSGLLGYAAGTAIGAPFGGFPGIITGAAGGMAGEFIGGQLLRGLAKFPVFKKYTEIEDPLANALGLKPRPILRDPDVEREKKRKEDYENNPHVQEFRARDAEKEVSIRDQKVISLPSDPDKLYSFREIEIMAANGNEEAIQFAKDQNKNADATPGYVTESRKTTLINPDGSTITSTQSYDSRGLAAGGLVTPNQDTSKKIKGKPTVWNNLYTEMVNNIKNKESTKVQPMTSMVKPMEDPKVTPKQVQSSPTSAINNKVDTLTGSSEAKVQRSKQSTTTTRIMVMRQNITRSVQAPAPKVIDVTKSPSPLLT